MTYDYKILIYNKHIFDHLELGKPANLIASEGSRQFINGFPLKMLSNMLKIDPFWTLRHHQMIINVSRGSATFIKNVLKSTAGLINVHDWRREEGKEELPFP